MEDVVVRFVQTMDEVHDFNTWLGERRPTLVGFDLETSGLRWWDGKLRLAQISDDRIGWAFDWRRWSGAVIEAMGRFLQSRNELVGHNIKFDAHWFREGCGFELPWELVHDTMLKARLINPLASAGLKPLANRWVHPRASAGDQRLRQTMAERGWDWGTVPIDLPDYWAYGALDPVITCRLDAALQPELQAAGLQDVYDLERPVEAIAYRMERHGCLIDTVYCERVGDQLRAEASRLVREIKKLGVENVASNKQLAEWLLRQGEPLTEKTEKGDWAMDKTVLRYIALQGVNPVVRLVAQVALTVRRHRKVANTYLLKFVDMSDSDQILHASLNTLAAKTGRQSVSEPSLQNLIRGSQVRDAFVARPGHKLVTADFDQIEVRLLAHFCQDPLLISAILSGNIHLSTAKMIYRDETIDKHDARYVPTKNATYAKVYGAGIPKFAVTAGISLENAEFVMRRYAELYPGVDQFIGRLIATCRQRSEELGHPYVRTPLGRRLLGEPGLEYKLVNYLIQGAAADVMKRQTVEVANAGLEEFMLLTVHDEVVLDVPEELVPDVVQTLQKVMPDHDNWVVPLTVGVDVYDRWGDKYRTEPEGLSVTA